MTPTTERSPQRGDLGQAQERFEELLALAKLRSNPATRRLNDRRIGLIALLLLAVLARKRTRTVETISARESHQRVDSRCVLDSIHSLPMANFFHYKVNHL